MRGHSDKNTKGEMTDFENRLIFKRYVLPMLFQLIGRSLRFNLHKDSLFEDVCDKDDGRYNYNWFLITYQCH